MTTCTHCGSPLRHRSDSDHGMFWAVMDRAYDNWPEREGLFQPTSKEHLYGWLLIEVGHSESIEIETKDYEVAKVFARGFFTLTRRKIHCMRVFETEKGMRITVPQSLSYAEAGKKKYEDVRAKVYELVEVILGVQIATLKREAQREAA